MGSLEIKDDLLKEIETFARVRGVPVKQQAEEWIHESLIRHSSQRGLRTMLEAIAALTPTETTQTDSVDLIREVRNR
jgi:hypothetical protein